MRLVSCLLALAIGLDVVVAQTGDTAIRFRPADPVMADDDTKLDASAFAELELSENFDFLENQFGSPGDPTPTRARNVNTIDEVPDSSWFTNRIGVRPMPLREILRGANTFDPAEAREWDSWTIVSGKGPGGFQPGFRAERRGDPGKVYQLEVDPRSHPRLATGAEFVGSLIYHALGYHIEDFYVLKVHPRSFTISEKAKIRDASGERKFTQHDLKNILRVAATDAEGRVYFSAARFDGEDVGHFEYHGTRSDDPNDIYPHEHRRELRANRVFAAWLAHDDSRAVNTRNIRLKAPDGRTFIRHYMHDFGAIMGSSTRYPESRPDGSMYLEGNGSGLKRLLTLGLAPTDSRRKTLPSSHPSVGWFESESFRPEGWRPSYPNAAFLNMQPDDAFWAARLVARFSDDILEAIVTSAGYDDPQAVEYLVNTLARRRDIVTRHWLNGVNPIVDVTLDPSGGLAFANAAVANGVATHGTYTLAWASFDNQTGETRQVSVEKSPAPKGTAPAVLLSKADYIALTIWSEHPDQPGWAEPVRVFFRKDSAGWKTVGLLRLTEDRRRRSSRS
jgi:hypothetical protein